MSERKVLNKYYPPDFDPSKIPKLKLPKDRQYVVRLMAPFNMRCKTCGEYIYKGKKFNARKETVQNESYLGLPIFRFYIKCTRCLAEITFKTDPENTDYAMEHGATRNFQAEKLLEEEEKRVQKEREDEELNNPMKVLENRTKDSKLEMEVLENLQELKELNQRQAHVDFESMLQQYRDYEAQQKQRELEEDEQEMKAMLEQAQGRKLLEDSDSDEDRPTPHVKPPAKGKPTDILQEDSEPKPKKLKIESWEKSVGKLSQKTKLSGLVAAKRRPGLGLANGAGGLDTPATRAPTCACLYPTLTRWMDGCAVVMNAQMYTLQIDTHICVGLGWQQNSEVCLKREKKKKGLLRTKPPRLVHGRARHKERQTVHNLDYKSHCTMKDSLIAV